MFLSQVFAIEDSQGFLQRLDFLLTPLHTIFKADSCIHTRWLELVKVCQGSIQLFLCTFQVRLFDCQGLFFVLLLCCLVFDVCCLCLFIDLGIGHEGVVLFLSCLTCLICLIFLTCLTYLTCLILMIYLISSTCLTYLT